jgi:epoxyqueuosine reductase
MWCPLCRRHRLTLILISDLRARLESRARNEGFDALRITKASLPAIKGQELTAYVDANHHGDMAWMPETLERRVTPTAMYAEAKSAIMLAVNYAQGLDAFARLEQKSTGVI